MGHSTFERYRSPYNFHFYIQGAKIQSQDVRTTGTYTYGILKFSSSPYHFVQSIGALPGGIGRSGMVRSKELDLCYNFHFSILMSRRLKKSEDCMSEEHGQTVVGFRQSEVPPTPKFNPLGHFQAESAGRAWLVRKNSISATTFGFADFRFWRSGDPEIRHPWAPLT